MNKLQLAAIAFTGVLALAAVAPTASAATLRYTFTGNGSGSVKGEAFTDRAFAIVGEGAPSTVAPCSVNDCMFVDFSSASVSIDGLGNFSISSTLRVFNTLGNLGLSRGGAGGTDLFNVFSVPVDYDFSLPIGPILGVATLLQWQGFEDVLLSSGGTLTFNDGDTDGSFSAKGVPLPSAAWLLGSALMLGTLRRRRDA